MQLDEEALDAIVPVSRTVNVPQERHGAAAASHHGKLKAMQASNMSLYRVAAERFP
jgi:hypothetical protein